MRFVLLHSPLMGPVTWQATAAELRNRGYVAEAPAWLPFEDAQQPYYTALVDDMVGKLGEGEPAVAVLHSGAGALAGVLQAAAGERLAGIILADAILPHPGRSWFDTAPAPLRDQLRRGAHAGLLPSWEKWWPPGALERLVPNALIRDVMLDELTELPAAFFEEVAPDADLAGPCGYLQFSGAYEEEARKVRAQGWPVARLGLHHLAPLARPTNVAEALHGIGQMVVKAG
jgi:pimeloyl-ACP methyl ester carboxylesterase